MKTKIKYLDSNFYQITDKAAGAIVKYCGFKLPKLGHAVDCSVVGIDDQSIFHLQRTPNCDKPRGWVWAIHSQTLWSSYFREAIIEIPSV